MEQVIGMHNFAKKTCIDGYNTWKAKQKLLLNNVKLVQLFQLPKNQLPHKSQLLRKNQQQQLRLYVSIMRQT